MPPNTFEAVYDTFETLIGLFSPEMDLEVVTQLPNFNRLQDNSVSPFKLTATPQLC